MLTEGSIYTTQSKEFQEVHLKYHLVLSPDGRLAASFNTENHELIIYETEIQNIGTEIFNKSTPIKYNDYAKLDLPS
ncbi:10052_t:CDS:2, partial [Funneliformis geosporum]